MIEFLEAASYWEWWILGAALVVLEVFAPGVIFLWMGIAAGVVGLIVLAAPAMEWEIQVLIFAALSVASVFVARRYLKRKPIETDHPNLNRRGQDLIGRVFTLDEPIVNGQARLKVGDSQWQVTGPDLASGASVRVAGIDGTKLRVEPN